MIKASVKQENGVPALYLDGVRTPPVFYALSDIPASKAGTDQAQKNIANFAECGINVVCVDSSLYLGWSKDGFDPSPVLQEVHDAIKANPNAAVIIRLHVNPPYWWMQENRDETYGYYSVESKEQEGYGDRLIAGDDAPLLRVSLTSDKWLKEAGECLRLFCRAALADPQAQRIAGIHLACGLYGEWHPWAFFNYDGDYGEAMRKYFTQFLRSKYGSDEALQAAWPDKTVTIETAKYSTRGDGTRKFRSQQEIDSFSALQQGIVEAIAHFARIVKMVMPTTLVGVFYGYFFNTTWNDRGAHGGCHIEIEQIYRNPDIDYIAAPFCYNQNRESGNSLQLRCLLESARLNGKLCLCEMDQAPIGTAEKVGGTDENRPESIAILKRNVLSGLIHGMGAWYYDHRLVPQGSIYEKNGWWDHPDLLKEITAMTDFAKRNLKKPFCKNSQVLLVCDTKRFYYRKTSDLTKTEVEFAFLDALGKSGCGYDVVYLFDLPKCDWSRYKAVLFYDCVYMDDETYDYVKTTVCSRSRTVVFVGDNGMIYDGGLDRARHESLTEDDGKAWTERVTPDAKIIHSNGVVTDSSVLRKLFADAGVWIYAKNGEAVEVDDGYVLIHGKDVPVSELSFVSGEISRSNEPVFTALYDSETGERIL